MIALIRDSSLNPLMRLIWYALLTTISKLVPAAGAALTGVDHSTVLPPVTLLISLL